MSTKRRTSIGRAVLLPSIGIAMLVGTLIWGAFIGGFPPWLLAMGGVATVLTVLAVIWQEGGSLRETAASLVYTFFVVLCVVILYLIAANHSVRFDITEHRIHSLSDQSVNLLRSSLADPLQLVVFAEPRDYASLSQFLDLYDRQSPLFSYQILDPVADVAVARQFGERIVPGDAFASLFRDGQLVRRHRFFLSPTHERRENVLSNNLLRTIKGGEDKVYFTAGKGERPLVMPENQARQTIDVSLGKLASLIDETMPVKAINLQHHSMVPGDASVVVIASPTIDLFSAEREMLIDYLDEGGSLLVMLDPTVVPDLQLTTLTGLLEYYGINSPNNVIIDPFGQPSPTHLLINDLGDHAIVDASGISGILMDWVRPLEAQPDTAEREVLIEPLLRTKADVRQGDAKVVAATQEFRLDRETETPGPLTVGLAAVYPTPGGVRGEVARIVVFGDSDFAGNHLITRSGSAKLLLQTVNWLAAREDQLAIPPKLLPGSELALTNRGFWLMNGCLLLISIGLLIGGVGFTVSRRRRR